MSPLLLVGLIASPGLLAFDEGIGTPALRAYNERYRAAVGHPLVLNNTDVTVMDGGGRACTAPTTTTTVKARCAG